MIRFGIVGGSGIAKKFARDIRLSKKAKLTAVSARNEKDAEIYKKEYQVDHAFASYEAMAKSDVIDAVYIATPHNFHYEQALLFIRYKKHVLVEKPIAVNHLQLDKMITFAKHNHVLLMEAMWTHFLPSSLFVKDYIETHDLGKLTEAELTFGYALVESTTKDKRLLNPDLAGGSLLDMGVYPISFYHYIQQAKIKNISATAKMTETGVDATTKIEITDRNNAKIKIQSSIETEFDNNAEFIFENGKIKMTDFSRSTEIFIDDDRYFMPFKGEGFVYQIDSFAKTIENHRLENEIRTHKSALRTLKTMDRVRKIIKLKYPFEKKKT